MTLTDILSIVVGLAMLGQASLLLLFAFEHLRFHRGRLHRPLDEGFTPAVTLVVPCKGLELKLEEHLAAVFKLNYPRYEVCFVVESADDPVVPVIHALRQRHAKVPSRLVVAGLAGDCGQKVHNLIQATRELPAETEVLAFVDSDACPHSDWLSRLVGRLKSDRNGVGTGYRWYAPVEPTLPNVLLSALNNQILGLMGPTQFNLAWGGAWAVRRETFAALGLPQAWQGTLSDDLTVSRLVHNSGLRVSYEPHCLSVSPAATTWPGLIEFIRRQYRIVRVYTPRWWLGAFAAGLLTNLLLVSGGALMTVAVLSGGRWWLPAAATCAYYLLMALRVDLVARGARPYLNASPASIRTIERWNVWGWPVVGLFSWLAIASTAFGREITWRGIRYRLDSANHTTILGRSPASPGCRASIGVERFESGPDELCVRERCPAPSIAKLAENQKPGIQSAAHQKP